MISRVWRARVGWRAAAAALALLAVLSLRVPLRSELAAAVPRARTHALAAHLADFNNLRAFYPHIDSWKVEEQWSNYTSWRYVVRFACGERCAGRGVVVAHDEYAPRGAQAAPRHGLTANAHRVFVKISTCRTPPLLPWPTFCDDRSVESLVTGNGAGGANLSEAASASVGLATWLAGRGASAALSTERRHHLQTLQAAFA